MPSRRAAALGGTSPRSGMRAGRLILRFQKSAYGVLCGRVRRALVLNLFSAAAPGAINTKERLQHVWYQCCGFDRFVEPAVLGRVAIELFLERLQQDNGDPHRFLTGQRAKFQIGHSFLPPDKKRPRRRSDISTLIGCEDEVAIDDHPHRKPRADGEGRLNIEVALCDLLTCLTEAVAAALAKR
jgi:hypothetical protein